jgi:hypothetical protein
MPSPTLLTEQERLSLDISGMNDSKNLIENLLSKEVSDGESLFTIYRNYRHLEIVSVRDNVVQSGTDTAPYLVVVNQAKQYLESKSFVVPTSSRPQRG